MAWWLRHTEFQELMRSRVDALGKPKPLAPCAKRLLQSKQMDQETAERIMDMEQRTDGWKKARWFTSSGTGCASQTGQSMFQSPGRALWEMVHPHTPFVPNAAMEWGTKMEDTAQKCFAKHTQDLGARTGLPVVEEVLEHGLIIPDPVHRPFIGGSPDGLSRYSDGTWRNLEIKCPKKMYSKVSESHFCQMQLCSWAIRTARHGNLKPIVPEACDYYVWESTDPTGQLFRAKHTVVNYRPDFMEHALKLMDRFWLRGVVHMVDYACSQWHACDDEHDFTRVWHDNGFDTGEWWDRDLPWRERRNAPIDLELLGVPRDILYPQRFDLTIPRITAEPLPSTTMRGSIPLDWGY